VPSLICDAFAEIDGAIELFLGPKRDFGRPQEEIDAEIAEAERVRRKAEEAQEKRRGEDLEEQTIQWDQGDGVHDCRVARLEPADEEFLAEKAKALEEYLDEAVFEQVAAVIAEVGRAMRDDPVDALAAFLFAAHRRRKAQQ